MNKIIDVCNDIENSLQVRAHQPAGPVYKNLCKRHALMCFKNKDDMKGIYSLTESHAPTYRIKTTYRYDKILASTENNQELTMNKQHISFNCPILCPEGIELMLNKVEELPKEWTIIQITTQFNLKESMQLDISKIYTDPLHISVFNCGQRNIKPFCITVAPPKDISGAPIELIKEMRSIINENKNLLFSCFGPQTDLTTVTLRQKKTYNEKRSMLNFRLKEVIKQIEKNWLGEWRCLLVGKFNDADATNEIFSNIDATIKNSGFKMTKEIQFLIHKIIAGSEYLTANEVLKAVNYCIPNNKDLKTKVYKDILNISNSFKFKNIKRHPVILIIDEKLDCFPWEMVDVLIDHPVSRIPSLHFAYALYKEHEKTIVNGFKEVAATDGSYIINPGLDLKKMEVRLKEFFKYWLPEWTGLVGQTPTSEQFTNCLTNGDIFIYNGHGSGTQFLSANKIQQMRVNNVVLLFGCSSVRMSPMGPFVEMVATDSSLFWTKYLSGGLRFRKVAPLIMSLYCKVFFDSPCVVGMIWEVTDFDTDILSTSLLSHWIPSKAQMHWKYVDKVKWERGAIIPLTTLQQKQKSPDWEPELLRAINIAQREPVQYMTKCAIVARGLPVKMKS